MYSVGRVALLSVVLSVSCLAISDVVVAQDEVTGDEVVKSESTQDPAPQGFFSIVFSGGLIGLAIILLLFALSLTAAYLVFEHIMTIRRNELMPEGLGDRVRDQKPTAFLDHLRENVNQFRRREPNEAASTSRLESKGSTSSSGSAEK